MSTTVKIFVVLNLVMCLAFAYFQMAAYVYRENWKRRWNEDTARLLEDAKSNADLAVRKGTEASLAQMNVRERDTQITDLQAREKALMGDIQTSKAEVTGLKAQLDKRDTDFNALNNNYQTAISSLEKVRTRMNELNHIAQVARGVAFNLNVKLAEIEDELNTEVAKNTKLQEDLDVAQKLIKRQDASLAFARDNYPEIYKEMVNPTAGAVPVSTVVSLVRTNPEGQQDIVILAVGSGQVQIGNEFIVYRGKDYICRVRVASVSKDMSTCRVIPESWNGKSLQIQQGDSAINRM